MGSVEVPLVFSAKSAMHDEDDARHQIGESITCVKDTHPSIPPHPTHPAL